VGVEMRTGRSKKLEVNLDLLDITIERINNKFKSKNRIIDEKLKGS
jgi:hypothetical protein